MPETASARSGIAAPPASTAATPTAAAELAASTWAEKPLGARAVLLLAATCVAAQLATRSQIQGYELADAVEYVERARHIADGRLALPSGSVRSVFFSLFFVPLFAIAEWLNLSDLRLVMHAAEALAMAFGVALVIATARFATRFASPPAALAAGFTLAISPTFLRFSVTPVADIAATLFLLIAIGLVIEPQTTARRAFVSGTFLGLASLASYKCLALAFLLIGCVVARERWRRRRIPLALCAALALCIGVLCAAEWVWNDGGSTSFGVYFHQNATSRLSHIAFMLHRSTSGWLSESARTVALWLFRLQNEALGMTGGESHVASMRLPPTWYLTHLSELLLLPALILALFGLGRFLGVPAWPHAIVLIVTLGYAYLTSTKGDKAMRLWLPIAPFLALWAAVGLELLARAGWRRVRWAWGVVFVASCLALSGARLAASNLRIHGGYWQAIEHVNAHAAPGERVGAGFAWAVFLRERSDLQLVPTPRQLMMPPPRPRRGEAPREPDAELLGWVDGLDWFVVHSPALGMHVGLHEHLSHSFDVGSVFYEQAEHAKAGPVLCLRRRNRAAATYDASLRDGSSAPSPVESPNAASQTSPRRTLLTIHRGGDADALRRRFGEPTARFERQTAKGFESLELVGWELDPLPGSPELWWLTYHWSTPTGLHHDYQIVDRWTAHDGDGLYQDNHWPAYGAWRTPTWEPGSIVSEGRLFVPASDPYRAGQPLRPLGGAYRRGDLLPLSFWLQIVQLDARGSIVGAMQGPHPMPQMLAPPLDNAFPAYRQLIDAGRSVEAASNEVALRLELDDEQKLELQRRVAASRTCWVVDGALQSKDGLVEVARALLPVGSLARRPDNGRDIED